MVKKLLLNLGGLVFMFATSFSLSAQISRSPLSALGRAELSPGGHTEDLLVFSFSSRFAPESNTGIGSSDPLVCGPVLVLGDEYKLYGLQIRAIEICLLPENKSVIKRVEPIIFDNATGTQLNARQSVECKYGWNRLELTNPVTIEKGKILSVGYLVSADANERLVGVDDSYPTLKNASFWYDSRQQKIISYHAQQLGNWAIRLILSDPKGSTQSLGVLPLSVRTEHLIFQNEDAHFLLPVLNLGQESITNLTFTVRGENLGEKSVELPATIAPHQSAFVRLPIELAQSDKELSFSIAKLNQKDNFCQHIRPQISAAVYDRTRAKQRELLIEDFTQETLSNYAKNEEFLVNLCRGFKEQNLLVNRLSIHLNDPFSNASCSKMFELFNPQQIPSCMISRGAVARELVWGIRDAETIAQAAFLEPSFVNMTLKREEVSGSANTDPYHYYVEVKCDRLNPEWEPEDLRLMVALSLDEVPAQAAPLREKNYLHDNLLLRYITPFEGTPIDLKKGSHTERFEIRLSEKELKGRRPELVNVVVFVADNPQNVSPNNRKIYDSHTLYNRTNVAVTPITAEDVHPWKIGGGRLQIEIPFIEAALYTMQGQRLRWDAPLDAVPYILYIVDAHGVRHYYKILSSQL